MSYLYGLIGRKLGHSFSARFFNEKFKREGIPARYELFEIPSISDLPALVAAHADLVGLNVTIPYKQEVVPYLAHLTETAREIGAVNTVKVARWNEPLFPGSTTVKLEGHNTDAPGFRDALLPLLKGRPVEGAAALVLGTGGASKAVAYALRQMGISVRFVSRRAAADTLTYDDLTEEVMRRHDIIVNCTPLGMWPDVDACPAIPYEFLDSRHVCFDLIYNPEVTEFMRRSAARGAVVSNGLEMLYNQARLAWEFWQEPVKRSFMSRHVEIHRPDGTVDSYPLSVAHVIYDAAGDVTAATVEPFTAEIPSVEYLDTPLILHLKL